MVRILVVDDFDRWRHLVRLTLLVRPEWQVVAEASDGGDAVKKARDLQPDLVVLDIGLPTLNGIEAARQIRKVCPKSKIVFLSENRSLDIIEEALHAGAGGYVVKSDAALYLLPAVEAVLRGERFVSSSVTGSPLPTTGSRHEASFYPNDQTFLDYPTQFIGSALKIGNAAIVAATELHRTKLLPRLQVYGVDVGTSISQGRFMPLDADEALSTFMRDGRPDPALFMKGFGDLITAALRATNVERPRVAIFGECAHLLWERGNAEAAVQMEKLGNKLIRTYDIDILCGYCLRGVDDGMNHELFQRICAEHSAVHSGEDIPRAMQ